MLIAILFFATTIALAFLIFYGDQNKRRNLPPGPFRFPLIGSVVQMGLLDAKYPHRALATLSKKYGGLMSIGFGVHYTVFVSSFEIMKDIFTRKEVSESRLEFPFVLARAFGIPDMGIIFNNGESWQELRRYTVRTLKQFGFGKKNSMTLIMQDEIADLVTTIKEQTINNVWKVDPELLGCSAINILWSLVAGYRFPRADKKLLRAVALNNSIILAVGMTNRYSAFPWVRKYFPKWSRYAEHVKDFVEMQKFLSGVVNEIKDKRSEKGNPAPENFIEAFLEEMEKRGPSDTNYNEKQLITILQDLFLAGSETTSNSLNWILLYVSIYPEVQRQIYEEIKRVIGIHGTPGLEHEINMPYVKATIYETLRMAVVLPVPGPRVATEQFKIEGYTIPKGAGVAFNMESVFHDKEFWGDPEVFRPERFLQRRKDSLARRGSILQYGMVNTERIAVFGFGKRICLGENLAWNSLFLFVTTLFQAFEFSVIPGMEPSLEPKMAATLAPEDYSLRVKLREE